MVWSIHAVRERLGKCLSVCVCFGQCISIGNRGYTTGIQRWSSHGPCAFLPASLDHNYNDHDLYIYLYTVLQLQ